MSEPIDLQGDFPYSSYQDWREAAVKLLKGADFEQKLVTPTYEGFSLQPLYQLADIAGLPHLQQYPAHGNTVRAVNASGYKLQAWGIAQEKKVCDAKELNQHLLQSLERGENVLHLVFDSGIQQGTFAWHQDGFQGNSLESFQTAVEQVNLDWISLHFQGGIATLPIFALLFAYLQEKKLPYDQIRGVLGMDPLSMLAEQGQLSIPLSQAYDDIAQMTQFAIAQGSPLKTVLIQTYGYQNAGCSASQELGIALATGVEYLRQLLERGINANDLADRVQFSCSVGSNLFMEIAKFRALRVLWNQVLVHFGIAEKDVSLSIHAKTSLWNKTIYDPQVNLLRATTEAFAAIIGGCTSLHVGTHDELTQVPSEFSHRVARNIQLVLQEECDLTQVIDPAGGSYCIEWLTDQLAQQGWKIFQEIESVGGMLPALQSSFLQEKISEIATKKRTNLEKRKDVLIGTNIYADPTERSKSPAVSMKSKQVPTPKRKESEIQQSLQELQNASKEDSNQVQHAIHASQFGATLAEIFQALHPESSENLPTVAPLPQKRIAEDMEALRQASERFEQKFGQPPQVLQVNLGPSRQYRLRADWTSGFFEVGGIQMHKERDFLDVNEALSAVKRSDHQAIILVSDDATYAESVANLAHAIKEAKPQCYLMVAGNGGEQTRVWHEAGVDEFVNVRTNNYHFLNQLLQHMGVL